MRFRPLCYLKARRFRLREKVFFLEKSLKVSFLTEDYDVNA